MIEDPRGTSAGGLVGAMTRESVIAISIFSAVATSTASARALEAQSPPAFVERTNTGCPAAEAELPGAAIAEIRRRSGLTWDHLAGVFGVSRRSLHFWASGKPVASANEDHLRQVLFVMRKIDKGDSDANRKALLTAGPGGRPLDLLAEKKYGRTIAMVGASQGLPPLSLPPLPEEERRARLPPPPSVLLSDDAPLEVKKGRTLSRKPLRTLRRK